MLAAAGAVWLARQRPVEALALVFVLAGNIGFFHDYRVHDLEVFFLPSTLVLSCLVGCGAQGLMDVVGRVVRAEKARAMSRLVVACLFAYPAFMGLGNFHAVDMSGFDDTDEFMAAAENTLPQGAVILNFTTPPEWKMDAVFGMYMQKVLGARRDVEVRTGATPHSVQALLDAGTPVFAYYPVPRLARVFRLAPAEPFFRVTEALRPIR